MVSDLRDKYGEPISVDSEHVTGTTGSSYVEALSWICADINQKSILLKNTSSTYTMYFKLVGYLSPSGLGQSIVSETSLAAGATVEFRYEDFWCTLILSVKNNSGGCDYELDYGGVPY
jgi:hypothetical protein